MPHIVIDPGGIRPVRLDRHEAKALADDQLAGDAFAHPIEFRRAMGRFAKQHDARRPDPLHQRMEIGGLDRGEGFGSVGEISNQRILARRNRPQWPAQRRTALTFRALPALRADQRDETNVRNIFAEIFVFRNSDDPHQLLGALIGADRDHQPPADLQLRLQRLRNQRRAGGHDDGIVGSMLRPAPGAIAVQDVNIVVAELSEQRRGLVRKLAETFDRIHIGRDLRQHRGGVTGTRADLENFLAALQHQGFRHEGDDIRLRNGLLACNRERRIVVGEFAKIFRQEQFARHLAHGVKHEFVAHAASGDISLDHFRAECGVRFQFAEAAVL